MANEEHLAILMQGVGAWNKWREHSPFLRAHLRGADLHRADLSGADLIRADLRGADLSWAHLREADLTGTHLGGADLSGADLRLATRFGTGSTSPSVSTTSSL
jgi:uncharacterized protein YjbI with pentapeptide repeats